MPRGWASGHIAMSRGTQVAPGATQPCGGVRGRGAASVAWTGIVITLGFLLGDSIARFLERSGAALLIIGVVAAGAVLGFRFLRRRVHGADDDIAATRAFCEFDVPKLEPGATLAGTELSRRPPSASGDCVVGDR